MKASRPHFLVFALLKCTFALTISAKCLCLKAILPTVTDFSTINHSLYIYSSPSTHICGSVHTYLHLRPHVST